MRGLPCTRCLRRCQEHPEHRCNGTALVCDYCKQQKRRCEEVPASVRPQAHYAYQLLQSRGEGWRQALRDVDYAMRRKPVTPRRSPSVESVAPEPSRKRRRLRATKSVSPKPSHEGEDELRAHSPSPALPPASRERTLVPPLEDVLAPARRPAGVSAFGNPQEVPEGLLAVIGRATVEWIHQSL